MSTQEIIEQPSPWSVGETVERLTKAVSDGGMQIFATIDHAKNARDAGLDMPASTVLIYGKAEDGTPIMLAHPQSALDLPLRVLIRDDGAGRARVSFRAIESALAVSGVPASVAGRLRPAQDLLLRALDA